MSKHQNRQPKVQRKSPEAPPSEPAIYQIVASHVVQFLKSRPVSRQVERWHYPAIALIPVLLTLLNANWLFENGPHMDPWYYFGHFEHFPRFHNLNPEYPGERIVWILPGYILTHLLGQVPGVMALHILTFLTCLYAFHFILVRITDGPTALLSTILLGCNAYFIGPNGWDFLEAQSWMFMLLSFALVIPKHPRRQWLYLTLSSMAWFGMIYGYVAWAVFSPAYLYVVIRLTRNEESYWRTTLRVLIFSGLGGILMTIACWTAYALMGGHGFFFANNLRAALYIGVDLRNNPWIDPEWIHRCTWLILPSTAFLIACAAAIFRFRHKVAEHALLCFHIYCFALLALWTLRPYRILSWDYRASVMLPGVFLVFALVVFRVPRNATVLQWWILLVGGATLSVAPLGVRALATNPPTVPIVLMFAAGVLLLACWTAFRQSNAVAWALMVCLFSGISFALTPPYTSTAWYSDYDGYAISERIHRALKIVSARVPKGLYPAFWGTGYNTPLSRDVRALSCVFFTQAYSMWYFPRVTLPPVNRKPPAGSRIFAVTANKDDAAAEIYDLARGGQPATVLSQDKVAYGDESFWLTQLQTMRSAGGVMRTGFTPVGQPISAPFAMEGSRSSGPAITLHRRVVPPQSGIYQIELSGIPSGMHVRFGAMYPDGRTWLEDSGPDLWFRLAVAAGAPIDLALEVPNGPAALRSMLPLLQVNILRDSDPTHTIAGFDRLVQRPYGNLLLNSAFEEGNDSWVCYRGVIRPAKNCYHGSCLEYAGSERGQAVVQEVSTPLSEGKQYELGVWVRTDDGSPQPLRIGVWDKRTGQWVASQAIDVTPGWNHYQLRFTCNTSDLLSVRFENTVESPKTIVLDDATLAEVR